MKLRRIMLAALIVVYFMDAGCAAVRQSGSLIETMRIVPDNVNAFLYLDVKSLRTDSALENLYDDFSERIGEDEMENEIGVSLLDVNDMAIASSPAGKWVIIRGEIDPDDVRYALQKRGFREDEYRDVEVWKDRYGRDAVSFMKDALVLSSFDNIKVSTRLNQSSGDSMYDDEDVKTVVDQLPGGVISLISRKGYMGSGAASAGGVALNKLVLGKGALEIRGWYRFKSTENAKANVSGLQRNLAEQYKASRVECQPQGEYVEATGETDISDFIESDAWRKGLF